MKNDKFDANLIASVSVMLTAIFTLGISSLSLMFHYVISDSYDCQSKSELVFQANYDLLSAENVANLEKGYIMLKTFRTTSSEVSTEKRIHQSVILSKDIDYQFQINCLKSSDNQVVFEMYTSNQDKLVKMFYLPSDKSKINVKVPETGLYILKLYGANDSENISGVLTIGGKTR